MLKSCATFGDDTDGGRPVTADKCCPGAPEVDRKGSSICSVLRGLSDGTAFGSVTLGVSDRQFEQYLWLFRKRGGFEANFEPYKEAFCSFG